MYKKEKNISNSADTVNLTGGTESGLKTGSPCDGPDFKTAGIETDRKAGPAGDGPDFKTGGTCGSLASYNKTHIKAGNNRYGTLSGKLSLLTLIGLSVAVLLLLAGFGLNFFNGAGNLNSGSLQEHALNPADLIDAIRNNQMQVGLLISYAGLIAIILVPAAGLIFIMSYFTCRKKYNLAITAAGVLFILILSAVIGLLKT